MSKSIFVIDTPNCCGECPLSGTGACRKWDRKDVGTFPKDCPLKEVPEKYETVSMDFERGYNACIDEILKESNKNETD